MKLRLTLFGVLISGSVVSVLAQSAFQNLDFESASPTFPFPGDQYDTTVATALPGWTAYVGGIPISRAFYNTIPLDSSIVGVADENAPTYMKTPLGDYGWCAVLAAGLGGIVGGQPTSSPEDVWLAQTGLIPAGSREVYFWTAGPTGSLIAGHDMMRFEVNGQELPLYAYGGSDDGWTLWGADVSSFAGSVAEIRFSLHSYYHAASGAYEMYLDEVSFYVVPEPSTAALLALGVVGLAWRTLRSRKRGFSTSTLR